MILTKYRINTTRGYVEFADKDSEEYKALLETEGISEEVVTEEVPDPIEPVQNEEE